MADYTRYGSMASGVIEGLEANRRRNRERRQDARYDRLDAAAEARDARRGELAAAQEGRAATRAGQQTELYEHEKSQRPAKAQEAAQASEHKRKMRESDAEIRKLTVENSKLERDYKIKRQAAFTARDTAGVAALDAKRAREIEVHEEKMAAATAAKTANEQKGKREAQKYSAEVSRELFRLGGTAIGGPIILKAMKENPNMTPPELRAFVYDEVLRKTGTRIDSLSVEGGKLTMVHGEGETGPARTDSWTAPQLKEFGDAVAGGENKKPNVQRGIALAKQAKPMIDELAKYTGLELTPEQAQRQQELLQQIRQLQKEMARLTPGGAVEFRDAPALRPDAGEAGALDTVADPDLTARKTAKEYARGLAGGALEKLGLRKPVVVGEAAAPSAPRPLPATQPAPANAPRYAEVFVPGPVPPAATPTTAAPTATPVAAGTEPAPKGFPPALWATLSPQDQEDALSVLETGRATVEQLVAVARSQQGGK